MDSENSHNKRKRDPFLIAGLIDLVFANVVHYVLPRFGLWKTDGFDLFWGVLMGIGIGLLLISIIRSTRRHRND